MIFRGRGRVIKGGFKGKGIIIRMPEFTIDRPRRMIVNREIILSIFDIDYLLSFY